MKINRSCSDLKILVILQIGKILMAVGLAILLVGGGLYLAGRLESPIGSPAWRYPYRARQPDLPDPTGYFHPAYR